jgi:uncharacterized protein (DUF1697 family)
MKKRFVALLRAISNVSMKPFRTAMEELGFNDVESYGMSGNLLFNAKGSNPAALEKKITARFGTPAIVRTDSHLAWVIAQDPFEASVLFLSRAPAVSRRRAFLELDFESPHPVIHGKTVYFVHPARLKGKRGSFDFELHLGVPGTARSAQVVRQLLARLTDNAGGESNLHDS